MRNFNVTVDGKTYQVQIEEVGSAQTAPVAAVQPTAPVGASAPVAAPVGGTPLNSPMPGMIVDLKVANGTAVKEGDVVLVLEAMKMENDIVAPCNGVVTFAVSKGASVNSGDLLASFK